MNESEKMKGGKGVESKLLKCGNDCNGFFTIKLRGLHVD
jgi:hypothetical protein